MQLNSAIWQYIELYMPLENFHQIINMTIEKCFFGLINLQFVNILSVLLLREL